MHHNGSQHSEAALDKSKRRGWLVTIRKVVAVGIVIVVLTYISSVISSNWDELSDSMTQANRGWLALHASAVLSYFALLPVMWGRVLRAIGISAPPRLIITSGYLPSLGKYVPGKIWSAASRAVLLNKYGEVPRTQAITATLLHYLFELGGAAPFLLVYAWLVPSPLISMGTIAPIVLPAIFLAAFPGASLRLVSAIFSRFGRAIKPSIIRVPFTPGVYSLFVLQWAIYASSGIALCQAFSYFDGLTAIGIGCAFVASWLIGFISLLTPGGIGVREGAMIVLLTPLVGSSTAALVSVLARIMWTIGDGGGILVALLASVTGKGRPNDYTVLREHSHYKHYK